MKKLAGLIGILIALACGGGGGGGGGTAPATLTGRVLSVSTGSTTNPLSSVQAGSKSVVTDNNGSFQLDVPAGTSSVVVDTRSSWGTFTFTFNPASGTTDVGDLWVGPNKVSVKGRVISSANDTPIELATVSFGGRRATTAADGTFTITNVAYDGASQSVFWGIVGSVSALDFFATSFSTQPNLAIGGVVTVGDIRMTPSNDVNPPPPPYNLWGRVSPTAQAPDTLATLKVNGTPIRVNKVGTDGIYRFWVGPGTYTIECTHGALSGTTTATLNAPNDVVRKDVTLQ